jgi:hypothetical protein
LVVRRGTVLVFSEGDKEMSGNNLKVSGIIIGNTAEKYPQTLKLFSANR